MDLSLITKSSRKLARAFTKNSPTILTALGVAGVVSTIILTIKATLKTSDILYYEARFRQDEYSEDTGEDPNSYPVVPVISLEDAIRLTWKQYIPTVVVGGMTIGCIIGANHINLRRNAALASLFAVTETAMKEYQQKVIDTIGEKKEDKIQSELAQDRLDKNPVDEKTIILTGNGDYLCFDLFSARYFRSDVEKLRRAENEFNQKLLRNDALGVNDFYDLIGLDPIQLGDELGWQAGRSMLELRWDSKLAKNNEPCLVISYSMTPQHF